MAIQTRTKKDEHFNKESYPYTTHGDSAQFHVICNKPENVYSLTRRACAPHVFRVSLLGERQLIDVVTQQEDLDQDYYKPG